MEDLRLRRGLERHPRRNPLMTNGDSFPETISPMESLRTLQTQSLQMTTEFPKCGYGFFLTFILSRNLSRNSPLLLIQLVPQFLQFP